MLGKLKRLNLNTLAVKTICCIFIVFSPFLLFAKEIGIFGNTWKIKEVDQAEYFKKKALKNRKKLEAYFQKLQQTTFNTISKKIAKLPSVKEHKKIVFKTEYSLPQDVYIPGNGKWYYYPAGYIFNPLDYSTEIGKFYYIIINPAKEAEVKLLKKKIKELKNSKIIKVLLAGIPDKPLPDGCIYSYLSKEVAEKLKIKGTPAFIFAYKKNLEVEYVPVENF